MASTRTLQQTINWALPFLFNKPFTIGTQNEPAITSANIIKQTILSPPFYWRWNRATAASFNLAQNTQDASVLLTDFGFIEKASVSIASSVGNYEMEIRQVLGLSGATSDSGRPAYIAPQSDDNAGNITFRVLPAADQAYTITPTYQKKPVLFASLTDTWGPIPDEYGHVYNMGFLGMMMAFGDDPRAGLFLNMFARNLLGVAEGLSETQKNIFLGNWLPLMGEQVSMQLKTQLGNQARA